MTISLPTPPESRARLWTEIAIVLALSLGASAVYSILRIIVRLTDETPLGSQGAALNAATNPREWVDFANQFLGIAFGLAPVALVLYLLWRPGRSGFARIGFDYRGPRVLRTDIGRGFLLLAVIGIPGIAFYALGRWLGITVNVVPAPADQYWWTIPILLLAAARAALTEEIIVVGYLFERLRALGWSAWTIILSAAVLRGSYHLYQGIGPFFGNIVMGVVFGWCYLRWGRVAPLVIAHFVIDALSFVGYPLAAAWWPSLFA